jgi:hypothetical protein
MSSAQKLHGNQERMNNQQNVGASAFALMASEKKEAVKAALSDRRSLRRAVRYVIAEVCSDQH